ncbi:MAG: M14 family metallopeptidase [Caulobacteraceae bacterium]|nr:M14 family metallopeptidase [Caulobacteraceae bacterium]
MLDDATSRYLRYAELVELLEKLAVRYPHLMTLGSIGRSHEGREIPVATVTNAATGPAADKPAMLVDGNIHASEVTASAVALHHLVSLLEGYGSDEAVTRCLDTRAFYIIPRVNPDGAEASLSDRPRYLRSSTRAYPFAEEPLSGLLFEDVDGDGRILTMRVADPFGQWKKHPDDPRIMIKRDPVEQGGEYYRLFPEGPIVNYDGATVSLFDGREGLDLNRNWPSNWRNEAIQPGAGPFPLSEPETHALASFVSNHPNIVTWIAGHTFSGVLLRPGFTVADDALPRGDLKFYKMVGERGTELTGYPAISTFHSFRVNKQSEIYGSIEWAYESMGIYMWAPEYWAPHRAAGFEVDDYAEWFYDHPEECDIKMMAWSDRELDGQGFVDWYAFDHPQLGPVELGGWDLVRGLVNPPEPLLRREVEPFTKWFTWQHLLSPRLEMISLSARPVGDDLWEIAAVAQNSGYLPTYGAESARKHKLVRGCLAEIELPAGAELVKGLAREDLGQLAGRSGEVTAYWTFEGTPDRARVTWVVRAPAASTLTVTLRHARAGRIQRSVSLA